MEQIPLKAEIRTVTGRKVKQLRKEGLIPAHVFGHKVQTIHIQVKKTEFKDVFEKAGETGIIDLKIDSKSHPVMVRGRQIHPVTDEVLHIDFYQVNLTEKVSVNVPIEITGEAPAVEKKIGLLLTPITEIEIEALPADIPESIEVDITNLLNIGDEIKVADLKVDRSKVEIATPEDLVVAQIGELVTREMEEVEAEVEAEQAEAAAEAQTAEGAEGAKEAGETAEGEESKAEPAEADSKEEPPKE